MNHIQGGKNDTATPLQGTETLREAQKKRLDKENDKKKGDTQEERMEKKERKKQQRKFLSLLGH